MMTRSITHPLPYWKRSSHPQYRAQSSLMAPQAPNKGLRHCKTGGEVVLGPEDEAFIYDLGVGHNLVPLKSPRAQRHEGNRMHQCIGPGAIRRPSRRRRLPVIVGVLPAG
ncbi:hypothetical protein QO002_001181 [Pararhizobium capsulatum DSM 1112]|uniref:Uncharacterized protein n=1 Tax=Pararhizobium capsulatum DSM 1112 TaxID=1121113 RepID=A0ABU0BMA6_9HYPH|nr:hypothetical protein [Pararhizobium capsulatum DSM 1112]